MLRHPPQRRSALSTPYWLPRAVIALRVQVFALGQRRRGHRRAQRRSRSRRFEQLYAHPAANGRSKGAGLSDLFWYWLSPGPEVHQEHLEAGPRYDDGGPHHRGDPGRHQRASCRPRGPCAAAVLDESVPGEGSAGPAARSDDAGVGGVLLRPGVPRTCPPQARRLITDNAEDVINSLKNTRLRHMRRRDRLTRYLLRRLAAGEVPHALPAALATPLDRAHYLQGTFFNTAVVQMSEAMAHLLLVLAEHQDVSSGWPPTRTTTATWATS